MWNNNCAVEHSLWGRQLDSGQRGQTRGVRECETRGTTDLVFIAKTGKIWAHTLTHMHTCVTKIDAFKLSGMPAGPHVLHVCQHSHKTMQIMLSTVTLAWIVASAPFLLFSGMLLHPLLVTLIINKDTSTCCQEDAGIEPLILGFVDNWATAALNSLPYFLIILHTNPSTDSERVELPRRWNLSVWWISFLPLGILGHSKQWWTYR